MELTVPLKHRLDSYLIARTALPSPDDMPAELIVISTGEEKSKWSYKHVFTAGQTCHFIFRKSEITDLNAVWLSADHELEAQVKNITPQTEKV